MIKKNILILSILASMIIGVIIGAVINKRYTSDLSSVKQNILQQYAQLPAKEQKIIEKKMDRAEKQQKKEAASFFSLLSDFFLRLIKMIIATLVFCVLVE